MMIAIVLRPPLRRWHCRLAAALRDRGHTVFVATDSNPSAISPVEVALALQQRVFGPGLSLFDRVPPRQEMPLDRIVDIDHLDAESTDLLILLYGAKVEHAPHVELMFDGRSGDAALLAMVSSDGTPCVEVLAHIGSGSSVIVAATLAIEDRDTLSRALDHVLARVVTLILQGVRRVETGARPFEVPRPTSSPGRPIRHIVRGFIRKIVGRLLPGRRGPDHWRVGFRRIDDEHDCRQKRGWPADPFHIIADDRSRFYADPFPFTHAGRRYIFVEDFPYATGKGVIAVTARASNSVAKPSTTPAPRHHHDLAAVSTRHHIPPSVTTT